MLLQVELLLTPRMLQNKLLNNNIVSLTFTEIYVFNSGYKIVINFSPINLFGLVSRPPSRCHRGLKKKPHQFPMNNSR